jgi:hypothetical protein
MTCADGDGDGDGDDHNNNNNKLSTHTSIYPFSLLSFLLSSTHKQLEYKCILFSFWQFFTANDPFRWRVRFHRYAAVILG